MELAIYRDIDNDVIKIGALRKSGSSIEFSYAPTYLESSLAAPVSLSLPLRDEPYSEIELAPYFRGLLPEGLALENLCATLGIGSSNYFDLLATCGLDCIGDIVINPNFYQNTRAYAPLAFDQLCSMANESTAIDVSLENARLSLAGTLSKCGLYHDPSTDIEHGWYQPFGGAPSNYIVKFAHERLRDLMQVEYLTMTCAKHCGISVASVELINPDRPILCAQRYDRITHSGACIDGLPVPKRRHQEDLTQAFGLLPSEKYCELEPSSIEVIATFLRNKSALPAQDLRAFAQIVLFNYLIGNCDNHLKNLSVLYEPFWRFFALAPAYDLASTTYFPRFSREMAMAIGEQKDIDEVTAKDFVLLAKQLGVSIRMIRAIGKKLAEAILPAIRQESERMASIGFENAPYIADDMEEDIQPRLEIVRSL